MAAFQQRDDGLGGRPRARLGNDDAASGAFPTVDVSWASRTKRAAGKTSPEELLAAAHAACYCMGLSHELGEAGTPPDRLEATATVDFVPGEGVTSSHIVVTGAVPGIDQARSPPPRPRRARAARSPAR